MASVLMTGCNESGGGAETAALPIDTAPPVNDPGLTDPGVTNPTPPAPTVPVTVPLTIYSMTRTIAPSSSYPALTFTATASCVEYEAHQFCWDDGVHDTVGGPMTFKDNYFGLQTNVTTGSPQSCKLSCNSSYMEPIRDVTSYRNVNLIVLGGTLGQEIDHILSTGAATLTSCTLDADTLTCGNVTFDVGGI
jgi:hypothetical protein